MTSADKVAARFLATQTPVETRVAARFLTAATLSMGDTFQNEKIRIHRYRESFKVTELENAGKRGKTCREASVGPNSHKVDVPEWMNRQAKAFLDYAKGSKPFDSIKSYISDLLVDFPGEIFWEERSLKGVDVEPYGEVYKWRKSQGGNEVRGQVSPLDFGITISTQMTGPKGNTFAQDTLYSPVSKKDAGLLYGYMKDNAKEVQGITLGSELSELFRHLGVRYDSH